MRLSKAILLLLIVLLFSNSCQKGQGSKVLAALKVGDCLDQPLSPYVLQVAAVEGEMIFYYHMGEMGKKIYNRPKAELLGGKSPYLKSSCP